MTVTSKSDLNEFFETNDSRIESELFDFLRIPSVSAKSENNGDVIRPPSGSGNQSRTPVSRGRFTRHRDILSLSANGAVRPMHRRFSSTVITMSSQPSRSSSGHRLRSNRPCATETSTRADQSTTKGSSSFT